jgi:hypothetical protein
LLTSQVTCLPPKSSRLALKRLIPNQPIHKYGRRDAVMATDEKKFQRAWIGIENSDEYQHHKF